MGVKKGLMEEGGLVREVVREELVSALIIKGI